MQLDRAQQIGGSPVVQEEEPLAYSPQWGGAEFIRASAALGNPVGKPTAHIVYEQVREKISVNIAERSDAGFSRPHRGRMADRAFRDVREEVPAIANRGRTAGTGASRCWLIEKAHEVCEVAYVA